MAIDIVNDREEWISEWMNKVNNESDYPETGEGWGEGFNGNFIFEVEVDDEYQKALQGGSEVLKARLDDQPDVISSSVIAVKDEAFHLYVHIKSDQPAGKLMAVAQKHALMLIPPFEFTNGGLRVTIAGTHEMIRKCLLELPDDIRVSVEQVGQYSPDGRNVLSLLGLVREKRDGGRLL